MEPGPEILPFPCEVIFSARGSLRGELSLALSQKPRPRLGVFGSRS